MYTVITQEKNETHYEVTYLHGVKKISQRTTTYKPNNGQTSIILFSTTLVRTRLKKNTVLLMKVKRTYLIKNNLLLLRKIFSNVSSLLCVRCPSFLRVKRRKENPIVSKSL